jgi:UDP-glucose 4-epimerase
MATPQLGTPLNILVTGGAGFIGSHLVKALLARGHFVTVLDDLSTSTGDLLDPSERLTFIEGDILKPAEVARAARRCGLVFHLASVVGKRLVAGNPGRAYEVSTTGTRNVLEGTDGSPVVLFSSSAVYGLNHAGLAAEDSVVSDADALAYDNGTRSYATGKLHAERLGATEAERGRGVLVVRPFNVVGPGQTGAYGMVLPTFVTCALSGQPLPVYGDGTQTRSFTHVTTFIECLLRLVDKTDAWRCPVSAVNVGVPTATSVQELADIVLQETRSRSPIQRVPFDAVFPGERDVLSRAPAVDRLTSLIGPVAWPSLRAVVRDFVSWAQRKQVRVTGERWPRSGDAAGAGDTP